MTDSIAPRFSVPSLTYAIDVSGESHEDDARAYLSDH